MKKIIHFMGLLANVDKSILDIKFKHGFKPEYMLEMKGVEVLKKLINLSYMELMMRQLKLSFYNFEEKRFYFLSNLIEDSAEIEEENAKMSRFNKAAQFNNNLVNGYLHPTLRLMRLFKEGNMCMPISIYYSAQGNNLKPFMKMESSLTVLPELYLFQPTEMETLEKFINETQLPFKEPYMNLAIENFELSYQVLNLDIRFLLLMMSLEALFNRGQPELKYTISRNSAVLLGRNTKDSNIIFEDMKRLYDMRSRIIHADKSNIIGKEDLSKLYSYVRKAIIKINGLDIDKDELFILLNSKGFGEMN